MERRLKLTLPSGKFLNVPTVRSRTMAAIRCKHNKTTERLLRMALVRSKISGWTLHETSLPGKPDLLFQRHKLVVFVHGCFWHGCVRCGHFPKTRPSFWRAKILRNRQRDHMNARELRRLGFHVLQVWEHSLKSPAETKTVLTRIKKALR